MELVAVVIALALIEYAIFSMLVGKARGTYGIDAPAISGHPTFERYYRVHQNTLEALISFIPGMVLFAYYMSADVAAGLGALFLIGRVLYLRAYVADPKSRTLGFVLGYIPTQILVIGGLIGAAMKLL